MESMKHEMDRVLQLQRQFFIKNGPPSNALRIDRIERLKTMLHDNRYKLVAAMNEDFGVRSKDVTLLSDIYTV